MTGVEFILVGLMVVSPVRQVQTAYINRFTTITACEAAVCMYQG